MAESIYCGSPGVQSSGGVQGCSRESSIGDPNLEFNKHVTCMDQLDGTQKCQQILLRIDTQAYPRTMNPHNIYVKYSSQISSQSNLHVIQPASLPP